MSESGMPLLRPRNRFQRDAEFAKKFADFDRKRGFEGWRLRVEQIADVDHLRYAYLRLEAEGGAAPGPDGATYDRLSVNEVFDNLRVLARVLKDGTYRPALAREKSIEKSTPGQYRTILMRNLMDRVAGKALQIATRPFWEYRFPRNCYAYRPRRGIWDMIAAIEVALRRTGRRVLAIGDVKTAFDTVPIDRVVHWHRVVLARVRLANYPRAERERMAALIEAVLRGDDPNQITGIDQGGCYSPTALNVLLGYELDRPLKTIPTNPLGFRYSDNIAYLVSSVSDGLHVLEQVNHLLLPLGMKLKGEGGGVHDLSTGDAVTLLGLDLQWTNGVLDLKPPVKAWTTLRQNLQECYKTPIPSRSALTVLTGWTSAYAPAVTDSDFGLMLSTAAEYGFREFNSETILQAWMKSWERWRRCRARASQRFRSTP